jgi:hypothetical protein
VRVVDESKYDSNIRQFEGKLDFIYERVYNRVAGSESSIPRIVQDSLQPLPNGKKDDYERTGKHMTPTHGCNGGGYKHTK